MPTLKSHFKTIATLFVILICLPSCAYKSFEKGDHTLRNFIWAKGGWKIHYIGLIHQEGFEYLKQVYAESIAEHGKAPSQLRISSSGGQSSAGIAMGKWVRDNNLNVLVGRRCKSACANYVFTAGVNKILSENSVLLWHGGGMIDESMEAGISRGLKYNVTEDELDEIYKNIKAQEPELSRAEFQKEFEKKAPKELLESGQKNGQIEKRRKIRREFYTALDTDPMIGEYGFQQRPNFAEEGLDGFYYSLEDLAYLGVKNIKLKTGKWEPDYDGKAFKVEQKYFNHERVEPEG